MKKKKVYMVMKYVLCSIRGQRCEEFEDMPYNTLMKPDCKNCDYGEGVK